MARLHIQSVSKRFGTNTNAVSDINLDIADGEFMVLLGPSGCGKSTLLRMIAGLEEPSEGAILLDGRDITYQPPQQRDLAMVFQSYALYPHLSVARNIGFPLRARRWAKSKIAERVSEVATALELDALLDRKPAALSGGQRQRVALARAMVRQPGAFLMDEPLSNLDAKLRSATRSELIALHKRLGSTFLYVTHDQVEAMTMATRIALLNGGRVEQVGSPTELYDTPRSTFVAGFLGSPPMNLFDAVVSQSGGELRLTADGIDVALDIDDALPADHADQPVTAGIRPERLKLSADNGIRGTVTLIENLGSEELVHVAVGSHTVLLRAARPAGPEVGESVSLQVAASDIHLFHPESGLRMQWQRPERATASVSSHMSPDGAEAVA